MIEFNQQANGGTELFVRELQKRLPENLLNEFQIICDRVTHLDENKYKILFLHNAPEQINNRNELANGRWKRFHKIVFVSYWQMEQYVKEYHIPLSHCRVLSLAIHPQKNIIKDPNQITLVYFSTPHRGLDILVNVFNQLCDEYSHLRLKVFSSYDIYGQMDIQREYEKSDLYQRLNENPKIDNLGFMSHPELQKEISKAHIFAYPCTWRECGCTSLLEAMSAELLCVHSSFGPLPELSAKWTMMYSFDENKEVHTCIFYHHLKRAIDTLKNEKVQRQLKYQSKYVNYFYNWETRTQEWIDLLKSLEHLNPKIAKKISFTYS